MDNKLPEVIEQKRLASPAPAPQALTFFDDFLWMGSRDLSRIYKLDPKSGAVLEEHAAPGKPWAAVATGRAIRFTIGEGAEDDRYIVEYQPGHEFKPNENGRASDELPARIACPDLTGSYLSWDGRRLYLSQWYKGRILGFDNNGGIEREITVGEEISGHVFVNGFVYVLRGTEKEGEKWRLGKFRLSDRNPVVEDVARVPFACRSLAFDGTNFWSNHRAAETIISFSLPANEIP